MRQGWRSAALAALIGAIGLAADAPGAAQRPEGEQALAAALAGRHAQPPVDCLDPQQARSTRIIAGTAILYDVGGRLLVQRPQGGAASLRSDDILVSRIEGGQLCRLDALTLVDPVSRMVRGVVVLGDFVPYVR